jgi:hypothetical protein
MISAPASQGAGALSSGLPPTRAFPAATLFLIDARVLNRLVT